MKLPALALLTALLTAGLAAAQSRITGSVMDADTRAPLPGATVVIAGTGAGTATDASGTFELSGLVPGTYTLTASFLGYEAASRVVTLRGEETAVHLLLAPSSLALEAMEVFASRATGRETPVAFTNLDRAQIQRELSSRDVPLVLNTAPSVYSTVQGGGAGDARVNVRGFNQRNVAIMINGVPVNDMENGWVYWSNWDGLGDATTSIQLQRGLSVVNLATPSIGGTLNIITDPARHARQIIAKQEFGNDGFLKSTVSLSTGQIRDRFAVTVSGVRKTGDGYYDGTWTDAWAYYAAAAFNINERHRIDLYAVGAPQRHGQNLYRQNIAAYDHDYAREVFEREGLSAEVISDILDTYPERGRRWNENVSAVSEGYSRTQHDGFGSVRRILATQINERENFFHKPQININHFAQLTDRALLSTVLYYSGGRGGGTGTSGRLQWDTSGPSRVVDYDATIRFNRKSGQSEGILRNSHNVQWTLGAISKLTQTVGEALTLEAGLDWRKAAIQHYRTVRDLLGGDGYLRFDSDFWGPDGRVLGPGDRFNYYNTNTVDWLGGYVQGEHATSALTAFAMAGYSAVRYAFTDHFRDAGNGIPFEASSGSIGGLQFKGGASLSLSPHVSAFVNAGLVSRVPIFDGAIDDITGVVNPQPHNEQFVALEAGLAVTSPDRSLSGKASAYHTTWNDRTITRTVTELDGDDGLINITGLNALHRGVEGELAYQPVDFMRADAAFSLGDWTYSDDVSASYTPDLSDPASQQQVSLYIRGIKVGDAPQTQFAYAVTFFPSQSLFAKLIGRSYSNYYANFDPTSRTDIFQAGQAVWKLPAYTVFDFHAGYDVPRKLSRLELRLFAGVFNVANAFYVQDATNNSRFNAYRDNGTGANSADDAEVFLGLPRTFNLGLQATFR